VNLEDAVTRGVAASFSNSGQSCSIPPRMLVPRHLMREAAQIAARAASTFRVGPALDPQSQLGPLVNRSQFDRVQGLIRTGIEQRATLVAGGAGRPQGLERGYFARPTVFADVDPQMTIAREEIFGPVLSMLPYDSEQQAIDMANDTPYGLAAYVQSADIGTIRHPTSARRLAAISARVTAANGVRPDCANIWKSSQWLATEPINWTTRN
jgi:aldehyde dehydrogenase (NAD+)